MRIALTLVTVLVMLMMAGSTFGQGDGYSCPPCGCPNDDKVFEAQGDCPACGMTLVTRMAPESPDAAEADGADTLDVAIVIVDNIELLDFAGPGEVFAAASNAARSLGRAQFNVFTVAPKEGMILSQGFLKVQPDYTIANAPQPDIIVIPGGGTGGLVNDEAFMAWVEGIYPDLTLSLTVCTGAFVFGNAGLLDGKAATTWYGALAGFRESFPEVTTHDHVRFIDNGDIVTTAGVSAGIDGALHVVARLCGEDVARATAQYMEYRWEPQIFLEPEDGAAVWATVEAFRGAMAGSEDGFATMERLLHEAFVFSGVRVDDLTQLATTDRAGYLEHFGHHEPGHYPRSGIETVDVNGRLARARLWFTHDRHTMHVSLTMLKIGNDWRIMSKNFYTERAPEQEAAAAS